MALAELIAGFADTTTVLIPNIYRRESHIMYFSEKMIFERLIELTKAKIKTLEGTN
jgi:hypothetical protein